MRRIIQRGAEAVLYLENRQEGKVLVKDRIKKGYRLPRLDERIRSQRTKRETGLISRARRSGVAAPLVFDTSDFSISMEYVQARKLKDRLNSMQKSKRMAVYELIGDAVARMHSSGIIHGDLTTSNMLLKDNKLYVIDFGLGKFSKKVEDQAADLYVLMEALKSTHFRHMQEAWSNILKAYQQRYSGARDIFKRIEKIKHRRRYMGE